MKGGEKFGIRVFRNSYICRKFCKIVKLLKKKGIIVKSTFILFPTCFIHQNVSRYSYCLIVRKETINNPILFQVFGLRSRDHHESKRVERVKHVKLKSFYIQTLRHVFDTDPFIVAKKHDNDESFRSFLFFLLFFPSQDVHMSHSILESGKTLACCRLRKGISCRGIGMTENREKRGEERR